MTTAENVNTTYSAEGIQTKFKEILHYVDTELGKFEYANRFERVTGVKKSYAALSLAGVGFLMIFFNLAGQLLTNGISWIYPAYASFKAIETKQKEDDTQWLTYWTVIGFVQMVEYFSDILLYWFPFYYLFKTLFVLWLALPRFRGAEVLYANFLRPYLLRAQNDIDSQTNEIKKKVSQMLGSDSSKSK